MKKKILSVFVSVAVVLFGCNINNVFAADGVEANILTGCAAEANNEDGAGIWCLLSTGLSILTYVVGVLAVLGVMIAGVQYIMSQGEPQKMAKAKNRILQVVIGLLIYAVMWSALRFLVPGFSLEKLNEYNGGSSSDSGGGNAPSPYVPTETQYTSDEIKSNFDSSSNSLRYDLNGSSKTVSINPNSSILCQNNGGSVYLQIITIRGGRDMRLISMKNIDECNKAVQFLKEKVGIKN